MSHPETTKLASAADLFDGPGDFLAEPAADRAESIEQLRIHRGAIAKWAAHALVNRHPEASPYRGVKGLLACEHELARHLGRLLQAQTSGDPGELSAYASWIAAVLARRRAPVNHLSTSIGVLREGVRRFIPWPRGDALAEQLRVAFESDG